MEVSQIIELMKAVADNGLTDFSYEENGMVLKIRKHPEKKEVICQSVAAPAVMAQQPAPQPLTCLLYTSFTICRGRRPDFSWISIRRIPVKVNL